MGLKKHNWRNVGVLLSTPLPNPSGITSVMCYIVYIYVYYYWVDPCKILMFSLHLVRLEAGLQHRWEQKADNDI